MGVSERLTRRGLIITIVLAMVLSMVPAAVAAEPIKLVVNGEEIQPDVPPQLIDNRTMVPIRWVSEALGADVTWDGDNQRVIVDSGSGSEVPDTAASSEIQLIVDGELIQPDVPPQLINNRTMVPVRWVSEALGAAVGWDQESQTVTITSGETGGTDTPDGAVSIPNEYDEPFTLADDELFIFIVNHGQYEIPGLLDKVFGDKLRAAFPDMNIKLTVWDKPIRTTDLEAAGIAPDIYMATPEYIDLELEKYGWAFDMTEMIEQSDIDLSAMNQGAVAQIASRSDGGMYGVPLYIKESVLFYNKEIFDKFGQPYPTNGMTYDEIYELTQKVMGQSGTVTYKGYVQHPDKYLSSNQLGLIPFVPGDSEEPSLEEIKASVDITTDDWLRITENMHRFLALPGNNFITTDDFFRKANYAMAVDEILKLPLYLMEEGYLEENDIPVYELWEPKLRDNIGVASIPVLSDEENWTYQPDVMSAFITKQSAKKEQAMEVIEWLASEEAQLQFSRNLLKAVVETDEVIEQFGADVETVSSIEGLGEAVYWGESAIVQNYENTEWPNDRFPLWFVFRQNVLQNGNPAEVALKNAEERDIANWYGWLPEDERE